MENDVGLAQGRGTSRRGATPRYLVFAVMEHLPSPEVVALLGEYLEDERDPWRGKPLSDGDYPPSNSACAVATLTKLKIQGAPWVKTTTEAEYAAILEKWKLWFAEVREGVRPFRFEGDSRFYNLQGPLKESELPPEITSEPGLARWKKLMSDPALVGKDARIEELSRGLRLTAERKIFPSGEAEKTHADLTECLLKIGGCADYYQNKLQGEWKDMESEKDPARKALLKDKFTRSQDEAFPTLALLPEPATVRVLGEFLFDDRDGLEPLPSETAEQRRSRWRRWLMAPNSNHALRAIEELPIESPPIQREIARTRPYDQDLEAWRNWFNQVKAGIKTFRFKGDPQEYNLQGPIKVEPLPEKGTK